VPVSDAELSAFATWFAANGGKLSGCRVARTAEGCGLVASEAISEGTTVVTVPHKLVLGVTRAQQANKLGDFLRSGDERVQGLPAVTVLALALLYERSLGAKSFWKPYLDVLPRSFSIPLFWSAADVMLLQGSPAFDEFSSFLKFVCRQYCTLYDAFGSTPGSPLALSSLTLASFMWAVGVVITRRNVVPIVANSAAEECLIPMWDMCNHRAGRITTIFDPATNQVVCDAQEATPAGEQVSIFYGARGVSHMLIFSGFVPPRSAAHDFVPLWLRLPAPPKDLPHDSPDRRDYELRKRLLESAKVPPGSHRVTRDAVGEQSLRFVRAVALRGEALVGATLETISQPLALPQLEEFALGMLRSALLELIGAYALDAAHDATADVESTGGAVVLSNADMARRLVARERGILRDAIAVVDSLLRANAERVTSVAAPDVDSSK
jgi:hypothetical protein